MLAYSEIGEGPALVLLHAFPMDRSLWREVAPALAELGWRVITPDLPGFGASPEPAASVEEMAERVALLLNELGEHAAVVAGCSMGGYAAMAFASLFPERTAGLVLVDTKGNADGEEARANRERIAEQVLSSGSTAALAVTQPDVMLSAETREQRPQVTAWLQDVIRAQQPAGVAAAQHAMAKRLEQFEMLAGLHVPVLCIRGSDDAISSADDHTRMARAARDGLDITVPGAGHLVPIETPDAFVEHVGAYLSHLRTPHC